MDRKSETSDEKHATSTHVSRAVKDLDTAAELASGDQGVLDPVEVLRIRFELIAPELYSQALTYVYVGARLTGISSH